MAMNQEIREQHKKMNDMSRKEKFSYILYYYKVHIIIAVVLIAVIISFIYSIVTRKDSVMNAALLNTNVYDSSMTHLKPDFIEYAGIDSSQFDVMIDTGMSINYDASDQMSFSYAQKITAMLSAGSLDVIVADAPVIDNYASISAFVNLEEVLPEDLQKKLEGKYEYYYYEYEEDGRIPIGLYIDDSVILKDGYNDGKQKGVYSDSVRPIFTISSTAVNTDHAIRFLEFLLSKNNLD